MDNLRTNQYVELFNPLKNSYFPVRIKDKIKEGYRAVSILSGKEINIYYYQLKNYGFRKIWVSDSILKKLNFNKNNLIYKLEDVIIFECLIGKLENVDDPYYLYEYKSKHLGFAILDQDNIEDFKQQFEQMNYDSPEDLIKEQYSFAQSIDDIFKKLIQNKPDQYNFNFFDKIITEK